MGAALQWASVAVAGLSAACWLRSATVKVTREQEVERRKRAAMRAGTAPNLAGVSLDGWDMAATFAAQSRWNAAGAILAGLAVLLQAVAPLV